jgi:hypothetical protein
MPYTVAIFFHLVGVITMFSGIATLIFSVLAIRRARSLGELRAVLAPLTAGKRIGFESVGVIDVLVIAGVLCTAIAGVYLASQTDRFSEAWIRAATVAFLLIAPLGAGVVNPRLHGIMAAAVGPSDTPLDGRLLARTHSAVMPVALCVMASIMLSIVFLMTNKPPLTGSLITLACGLAGRLLTGCLVARWLRAPIG